MRARLRPWWVFAALGAAWLVISGFVLARDPITGLAVGIAPIAAVMIVRHSWIRLTAVVVGGMFVLGSSSDLSSNKIVYAAVILVCAVISAWRLIENPPGFAYIFRPLLWWGMAFAVILLFSYLLSPGGSDFGTFGRQSLFYVLIILGPIIGLDSGRDVKPGAVYAIIGVTGTVAAIGFAFDWLDRRGVTALPMGRFVLSSLVLPGYTFALALVLIFFATTIWQRLLWAIPLMTVPIAMLVTGTRTNLIIFIAAIAVVGRRVNRRVPLLRLIVLVVVAGMIGGFLFPIIASLVIEQPGFIENRIKAALTVLTGSAGADQSFAGRSQQYTIALDMINRSQVLGYGLGYRIPFTIDSPLLSVVRLGWLGVGVIVAFIGVLTVGVWRSARHYGHSPAHTAWWGFLFVIIANIPFGTPLEDRGFGFAIMLATMALASELARSSSRRDFVVEPAPRPHRKRVLAEATL